MLKDDPAGTPPDQDTTRCGPASIVQGKYLVYSQCTPKSRQPAFTPTSFKRERAGCPVRSVPDAASMSV